MLRVGIVVGAAVIAAAQRIRCISASLAGDRRARAGVWRDPPLADVGRSSALHHI